MWLVHLFYKSLFGAKQFAKQELKRITEKTEKRKEEKEKGPCYWA
jgi:hypothetical protein